MGKTFVVLFKPQKPRNFFPLEISRYTACKWPYCNQDDYTVDPVNFTVTLISLFFAVGKGKRK